MDTGPDDVAFAKLNVPSYRVPVQCAEIDPVAAPFVHESASDTSVALMLPSTFTTGVPGDHVSWTDPVAPANTWLANVIGAGYWGVAHALTLIDDRKFTDHSGTLPPPPLPALG